MWPVPSDTSKVRAFLASVQITKPWVKNFSEIARPLSRLAGNVEWTWGPSEQVAFQLLRENCSSCTERYGFDPTKRAYMYTDASKYGTGCVILQYHSINGQSIAKPVLYDSTTLTKTQRNYGTYKRELLAIVTYAKKYSYMFAGKRGKVMTDHKPLTRFLESPYVEGIYARWNADLLVLNLDIEYISGKRNEIADALSRTIFPDPECDPDDILLEQGELKEKDDNSVEWIWKDGAGGYAEFIAKEREREIKETPRDTLQSKQTDRGEALMAYLVSGMIEKDTMFESLSNSLNENPYSSDLWYGEIFKYLSYGYREREMDRLQLRTFLRKCSNYQI
ncbi:hypothetical protein K3495_g16117, partial [Podosphaera aphanis]